MAEMFYGSEGCPNCTHSLDHHDKDNGGCQVDWKYDEDGIAQNQGCVCNLAIAGHL